MSSRRLHLDPVAGVAGDMWLGMLADLGLPDAFFAALPERLGLPGVEVRVEAVQRGAMAARKVRVIVGGLEELPATPADAPHDHGADDRERHSPAGAHSHGPSRHLADMLAFVDAARLPERAGHRARRAITLLYEAEARVHGVAIENVHLHEAGADDALVDILGTCLGLEELGIDEVSCSTPIPLGGGSIRCAHGILPVPAPAVAEILRGIEVRGGPIDRELVTPTGAALLRAVVDSFGPCPALRIDRVGSGAGTRDDGGLPNVLRGILGTGEAAGPRSTRVAVIETAIDDALPQDLAALCDRLLAEGALDVMSVPATMKKGRIGQWITVIARPDDAQRLAGRILHESPTLGVRMREEERLEWERDVVSVDTPWGPVRVKRARDTSGRVLRGQPEFEDCRRLAEEHEVPLERVRDAARRAGDDSP